MNGGAGAGKTVLKVLYFILTFLLGGLLAVMLPNWLLYENVSSGVAESLEAERYTGSVLPLSGYFDRRPAFREVFGENPKQGFVLFPAAFAREVTDEKTGERKQKILLSYTGYLYGVKEAYPTAAKENNGTIVRVTDDAGKTNDYPILNYDLDADGNFDSNATLQEKGFLCLEIDRETFGKPAKIDFYDKDGRLFRSFETRLNCDEEFFRDAVLFADEYNSGMDAEKFRQADENFRAKNENYLIGSVDEYRPKSIAVSCVIVVAYFLLIYALYDLTLGKRYIVRGIKKIIEKLFHVDFGKKEREKAEREQSELLLGKDYFSKVTVTLDVSDVPGFRESVEVRYSSPEHGDIAFQLLPSEGYSASRRIHAGVYRNPWIEMDRSYEAADLPENLVVEGFQMDVKIKIRDRGVKS